MATTKIDSTGVTFPDGSVQSTSALGPTPNVQIFNSTGTWTKPAGSYKYAVIQLWGGGGGGCTGGQGGGGGGGGYTQFLILLSRLPSSLTASVGGGGSGGYAAGSGGTSTVSWAGSGSSYCGVTSVSAYGGGGASFYTGLPGGGANSFGFNISYGYAYIAGGLVLGSSISEYGQGGVDMGAGGAAGANQASITGVSAGAGGNYGANNGQSGKIIISCY